MRGQTTKIDSKVGETSRNRSVPSLSSSNRFIGGIYRVYQCIHGRQGRFHGDWTEIRRVDCEGQGETMNRYIEVEIQRGGLL